MTRLARVGCVRRSVLVSPGSILLAGGALLAANASVWCWAAVSLHGRPVLFGTALLAYVLGLRHAVDADHIAAIDNATRKLMQAGQRPLSVGFFFSAGHSALIVAFSAVVAFATSHFSQRFEAFRAVGALIGTAASATVLLLLAAVNVTILMSLYRMFRRVKRGEPLDNAGVNDLLNGRGLVLRLLRPTFRIVTKSWHMFVIGALFGLGFDTASEIALFAIAAGQTSHGVSLATVMLFPALFAVGMCTVDTADGMLMVGAYGWALDNPVRKLYYNMAMTCLSVIVALLIGGVEFLSIIADRFNSLAFVRSFTGTVGDYFGVLGYAIVAVFLASWALSVFAYRRRPVPGRPPRVWTGDF
ncbi:HoxN/HupN/NixA family nickel/cobalt transporter [Paraburkholderia phenoliruptrix]|uniref:HoxN/HupN/NixA family nickel/cobalt transporter n=1 Tax=Paraburkholderia phenoliruptrix TaxID=252970 RepID=UPI00142EC64A|nr:HoxN/HupN/NixA family nickel/cobalt transporter [Paraburkholderia phenoliruptrix]MBW9099506.1 HoxN/HupN/NixA family nickel/cobalt transporter [Paraburkholderia phenoliruptrix]